MRLWSLHPSYLDAHGLVAWWREGLLARAVLLGRTQGYRHHPQLIRFRVLPRPMEGLEAYLGHVLDEAEQRGYRFDRSKITRREGRAALTVSQGQLDFEQAHLLAKLSKRDPQRYALLAAEPRARPHPFFTVRPGPAASWERGQTGEPS